MVSTQLGQENTNIAALPTTLEAGSAPNVTIEDKLAIASLIKVIQKTSADSNWEKQTAVKGLRHFGRAALPEISAAFVKGGLEIRKLLLPLLLEQKCPETAKTLRDMLSREAHKRISTGGILKGYLLFVGVTIPLIMALDYLLAITLFRGSHPKTMFTNLFMCLWLPLWFIFLGFFVGGFSSDATLRRKSVQALAEYGRDDVVGILSACLADRDGKVRAIAESSLLSLLPQVREGGDKLSLLETRTLVSAISGKNPEFSLVILKALARIGDAKAVPQIEARVRQLKTASYQEQRLRDEAEICLNALRHRAAETTHSKTLLRASAPDQTGAHATLLRPVQPGPSAEASELLRAEDAYRHD